MTQQENAKVQPAQKPVFTNEHPEYPFLVYNHKTRQTRAAKDKEDKAKLAEQGFVDDPYPPEDVDALTQTEVEQLQGLLAKAAKALAKLGKLSERHEHETHAEPVKK